MKILPPNLRLLLLCVGMLVTSICPAQITFALGSGGALMYRNGNGALKPVNVVRTVGTGLELDANGKLTATGVSSTTVIPGVPADYAQMQTNVRLAQSDIRSLSATTGSLTLSNQTLTNNLANLGVQVSSLNQALGLKADAVHTHLSQDVRDFVAAVRSQFKAGYGIAISDGVISVTVSTGGGGAPPTTDASQLTAGTLADARLGANVVRTGDTQTMTNKTLTAPRITSPTGLVKGDVGLGNVPNLDATNPANTVQDITHRYLTDVERAAWNGYATTISSLQTGKLNQSVFESYAVDLNSQIANINVAIGQRLTKATSDGLYLSINTTFTKASVGLANVPNVDATNPNNTFQDATHRYATDAEKATWSGHGTQISELQTTKLSLTTFTSYTASQAGIVANLNTLLADKLTKATADGLYKSLNYTPTKAEVGLANVPNVDATNASNISSGTMAPGRLGNGTPDGTKVLYGDGNWKVPPTGSGGGGGSTGGSVYSNTDLTQSAVQTLVNNASDNTRIVLAPGVYPWTGALLIENKTGMTLDGGGQVTFVGNINMFVQLSGLIKRLRITGIKFQSTSTSLAEVESMLTTTQTIEGEDFELDHCYFTGPGGNFNGMGWVPVDGRANQPTNTRVFRHINVHHNSFIGLGRCGVELLNQNLDFCRVYGLTISDNYISSTGLHNEYGMGISLSGYMLGTVLDGNHIYESAKYAIEVINCKNTTITNNIIQTSVVGCAGISVNAQNDDNGRPVLNEQVSVSGNQVYSRHSPIQMSDVSYVSVMNNKFNNVNSTNIDAGGCRFVRVNQGKFLGNDVLSNSYNALILDNSPNWIVTANYMTNKTNVNPYSGSFQLVWLYGAGTTNCRVHDNIYEKDPAKTDLNGNVREDNGAANNIFTQN